MDAPVSGGVPGAEAGTLTFMVGGTNEEFNSVKPVLEGMGKKITHCGGYGMGQAAKICNNMMLGISMVIHNNSVHSKDLRASYTYYHIEIFQVGLSEVMNLAIRLGLDPKQFAEIINSSTGRSWASEINNPVPGIIPTAPASRNYDGGFQTGLMTKVGF